MGVFTLPILSGIGKLAGGILGNSSARKSANKANNQAAVDAARLRRDDRTRFVKDRENERQYSYGLWREERGYAEKMRDNERAYAEDILLDQRTYNERQLSSDRAYLDQMKDRDVAAYRKDRDFMQGRSNELAEKTTASRGVDFVKLRDDAVAAGYNPMTALSMAHAYSKQVDYTLQGGVHSPQANYTVTSPGGSGGGGGAAPGAVMPAQLPAGGGIQVGGSGYQANFQPALSTGSFISEAVDRAVDAWSNQPVTKDPLADALRNAFQQDQMADEVRSSQIPQSRGFGYDLTKQEAFQPAATIGVPSLRSEQSKGLQAPNRPPRNPASAVEPMQVYRNSLGRKITLPESVGRSLNKEPGDRIMPGDWSEIKGELWGEVGAAVSGIDIEESLDGNRGGVDISPNVRDYLKYGITGTKGLNWDRGYNHSTDTRNPYRSRY